MTDVRGLTRVADALAESGIKMSQRHVSRLVKNGQIPGARVGRCWFTTAEALKAALVQTAEAKA